MKKLYVSYITEYEASWGNKPDGLVLSVNIEILKKEIKEQHKKDTYNCYWIYSDPKEIFIEETKWEIIKFDNFKYFKENSLKPISEFYNLIN